MVMKPTNLVTASPSEQLAPIKLLEDLIENQANGFLSVVSNSITWQLYFHQGLLTYATYSIDPFERLDRHLRRLSHQISVLTPALRNEVRLKFDGERQDETAYPNDYRAIAWLVSENYINSEVAATLIKRIIREVFEAYLLLTEGSYTFTQDTERGLYFCHVNPIFLVKEVEDSLKSWQALAPVISCPNQRPYFFSQNQSVQQISVEQQQKLSKLLRGFSFRQIGVLVNQDELKIAQYLYPLIKSKVVILRDPQSPYDRLPKCQPILDNSPASTAFVANSSDFVGSTTPLPGATDGVQQKVVCVDDSPTILTEINRFLDGHNLSIHALTDSSKALMEIMRIKPDLVLLDVGMPTIDGYKLCRAIRNHSLFKQTPIVMVTGNTGLIDRAKARMAGATDYLTKPFTQPELVKMVFRYLT